MEREDVAPYRATHDGRHHVSIVGHGNFASCMLAATGRGLGMIPATLSRAHSGNQNLRCP